MKKFSLLLAVCFTVNQITFSQITNTFPLNDSVGIGTTTPQAIFEVSGGDALINQLTVGTGKANNFGVGIGFYVLESNVSGEYNISIGQYALSENLSGSYNVAVGPSSLKANLSGDSNVAIGSNSLLANTSGYHNTAVGTASLRFNITGKFNCAFGSSTLSENTTGEDNTALGNGCLSSNTIGSNNIAVGSNALNSNIKGNYSTALGVLSLFAMEKGMNNTACGAYAFDSPTKGSNNTAIGYNSDMTSNFNNATVIGADAIVDASNKVRIGNSSITSNGGQVEWTAYSDARIKNNIKENVPGLEFINLLKPVTFHFDVDKQNGLSGVNIKENTEGMYDIEKIQWTGFIAQDVEAAAKRINYDFSGVDKSGEIMGLRYSEFVVPLVKAVQELSDENQNLVAVNSNQSNEIEALERRITQLEKLITKQGIVLSDETANEVSKTQIQLQGTLNEAYLSQNIPNPFTGKTTIQYYVPETAQAAQIKIVNANGVNIFLADVKLGEGVLEIDAAQISAGTYSYILIVDGKVIDTKLIVIVR